MGMAPNTIRAVAFKQGDWWVARCLDHDLATQARTLQELRVELDRLLTAHVVICTEKGLLPFAGIPPAPDPYWQMFRRSRPDLDPPPERPRFHALATKHPIPIPELHIA